MEWVALTICGCQHAATIFGYSLALHRPAFLNKKLQSSFIMGMAFGIHLHIFDEVMIYQQGVT
jgi:hypothetical protein